jgi:hypothetical protein
MPYNLARIYRSTGGEDPGSAFRARSLARDTNVVAIQKINPRWRVNQASRHRLKLLLRMLLVELGQ